MGPQPEAILPFQSCEELEGSWGRLGSHLTQLLDSRTWLPPRGRTSTHSTPSPFSLLTDAVLGRPISGPWFLLLSQQISTSSLSQGGSFWEPDPRKGQGSLKNPGPNWPYPQACWSFWDPSFTKRSFFEFRPSGGELTHVQMMWFDNRSLT